MVQQNNNKFDQAYRLWDRNADDNIPDQFDQIAEITPQAVALRIGSVSGDALSILSYAQLAERSKTLAQVLLSKGVQPGDRVALSTTRGFDGVIGMLAILRVGAAYVPIDPAYPTVRRDFMLSDAGIKTAVVSSALSREWVLTNTTVVDPSAEAQDAADLPKVDASRAAYVIYTSGSTGTPKGVETSHRSVCSLVVDANYTKFGPGRRFLQLSSVSFDAATFEIWGALLNGGECVIYPSVGLPDLRELRAVLANADINTLWLTSSLFNSVIDTDPDILAPVKELLVGGEALSIDHIRKAQQCLSAQIINGYGPTETTTFACSYRLPPVLPPDMTSVPIGRPIHLAGVRILDEDLAPVAEGEVGELFIAGPGVGIGYLNRPELTAERFVTLEGERTYRTGDLVRLSPEGLIVFIGRKDGQVKVAGHRIELGEIEHVLRSHPEIANAAASVYHAKGKLPRIAAWVVRGQNTTNLSVTGLRAFVEEKLPAYMRPADYTFLEALPLTASGKLDRAALGTPLRQRPQLDHPYSPPRLGLERDIADIVEDVIGIEGIGRSDRFFELGGTSLMALQVLERLKRTKGQSITVAEFFDGPTVERIAACLQQSDTESAARTAPRDRPRTDNDRIAIVGVGGRFAGASDVSKFWEMLIEGRSGRVEVTRDDLIAAGEDPDLLDDPDYVAAAFPLEDVEGFDAKFFGFSPREVQIMDPQQRIFLESAWAALENAGHDPRQGSERIGVFGGVGRNAYLLHNLMSHPDLREAAHEYNMLIGNERDFPATHVAFRLGLRGPAVTVQTACSSSGVAIHMAAESLRRGECDLALSGGAKVLVPNRIGYRWTEGGPQSADGYLRAFDAEATGMVRGSGAAMVVLKRLEDAVQDGDHIYGVLIGSAVNNDGNMKAGFTAPSVSGQAEAIAEAYDSAGIEPGSITMIEAHGTGTVLGDPVEVSGLTRAFGKAAQNSGFCALGSVKTNIGHLDAGATAAGLIKSVLSLKHERIPPSLNFAKPNPNIDFANSPFFVPTQSVSWPRTDAPRRAGISSFGLGGTNVHLVVEEAPAPAPRDPVAGPHLFVLSARTDTALMQRAVDLADWLEANATCDLADVAHTLQYGRRRFEKRLSLVVNDHADAIEKLRKMAAQNRAATRKGSETPSVAFLFPGGGAQYANMAQGLYASNSVFKATIDACSAHFEHKTGQVLTDFMFQTDQAVEQPSIALPALLAVEIAMGRVWQSWGVMPSTMIGHSMGEYAAACLANVMSLEHAMDIVMARGRLFETLEEGSMLSVQATLEDIQPYLSPEISVAAVNRTDNCVLSGPVSAIAAVTQTLAEAGIEGRRVHINVAAHSHMVEPILDQFRAAFDDVTLNAPEIPFISNVTGLPITDAQATDPGYWVEHLRATVAFSKGLSTLLNDPEMVLLEIGPGQTLSGFARSHGARGAGHEVLATIRHPKEAPSDTEFLLEAVGKYWKAGGPIDWRVFAPKGSRRVPLPSYPFERTRHWIDAIPFGGNDAHIDPFEAAGEVVAAPAEAAPAVPQSRFDLILGELTGIINRLSGIPTEQIDPHATFLELGFDSLFLTQANAAFKKTFKVPLTTRQLLEATPRLFTLAEHLDGILAPDAPVLAGATAAPAAPQTAPSAATAIGKPAAAYSPGIASVVKTGTQGLTQAQEAHIDALIAATVARTPKAKASVASTRHVLADPRTVQGFRLRWKEMVYPILSDRAKGSKVWDVDGNEYIDLVGGYGVTFLGHQSDLVVDAIKAQIDKTLAIGPQSVLAGEVAQLVSDMTGMERVAFCNTGSEAVLAAVRMARTVTGKSKIAKFDGHYHGIFDEMQVRGSGQDSRNVTFPSAPGIPHEAVQNTIILDYGHPAAFDVIREQADDLALVLVEPVRSRNPDFQPKEYLQELRKVTEELGIPLLFDEIVTGFRSHPAGAQHVFGVRADLTTYGKVAGGGLPIGIVAGSAEYMDSLDGGMWEFGDASVPTADMTWFAGTFVRHPMALASTKATLQHLIAEGPALQENLNARSAKLAGDLNAFLRRTKAPIKIEHFASVLRVTFTAHQEYADLLFFHLRNRGIMTYEGRPIFLTTAHTDEDLAKVYDAFVESLRELMAVGLLDGRDPTATRRIPMATGQQEIWVSAQFSPEASASYILCSTLRLKGAFDTDTFQMALNDLADRHEALRSMPERDGLMQVIRAELHVPVVHHDLSDLSDAEQAAAIDRIEQAEVRNPFDLEAGPLVRASVLKLGDGDTKVLLSVHHVIADGWSCGVLLRELGALYEARRDGTQANLPEAVQLGDFIAYQQDPEQVSSRTESRDYWLDLHADGLNRVDFPSDRPRGNKRDFSAKRVEMMLDPVLTSKLRAVARDSKTTLFAALMGGFTAYVTRLTGAADTTIGFSAAGQPLLGGGSLVGHCVSFLPLKLTTDLASGFQQHVSGIGGSILDALEHQNFDFVSFVQEHQPTRDANFAPLITVGLNLDPAAKRLEFADFDVDAGSVGRAYENLDLFLNFVEVDNQLELQCTYNTALFDQDTIVKRMGEYLALLEHSADHPGAALGDVDFRTPEDRLLAVQPAAVHAAYDPKASVLSIFQNIARHQPDHIALSDASDGTDAGMSYAELVQAADDWALRLAQANVRKGDTVAVLLPRSMDYVVSILAILKVGAIYVPIDVETPPARIAYILNDSGAQVLLSVTDSVPNALPSEVVVLLSDQPAPVPADLSLAPPATNGDDPAYIMYTSGSTGAPKGVAVAQKAITSLLQGSSFATLDNTRTLGFLASPGFDASTFEIWGALLNGGTLAVIPGSGMPPLTELREMLEQSNVTTLWLTAALFNTIVDQDAGLLGTLREVLTGGEALSVPHVKAAQQANPGTQIINGYGPTECTTFTCCYRIPADFDANATSVPIGHPVSGRRAFIVDPHMRPLPAGIPGELVVAGDGVALGYWGREDLTDAAFVPDTQSDGASEGRLYKTGDICRYRTDGSIEFIGRRDAQVKVRGFRIEPAEIEAELLRIPGIDSAAVILAGSGETRRLVAFAVSADADLASGPDEASVLGHMRAHLPRHMVPASVVFTDRLPATRNGKLDRAALVAMLDTLKQDAKASPPSSAMERKLAAIWTNILNCPVDSVDHNFFDLGGHSLLALKLFDKIARDIGPDLPISTLFSHPTLRDLAQFLDQETAKNTAAPQPHSDDDPWDTSTVIHAGPAHAKRPFFIVGGAGGNVNNLIDLGRVIGQHRPVIGFQTRGIVGHKPRGCFKEIAAEHIFYMRQHQPTGPYALSGYSAGAQIAYEMARQLRDVGQEVSVLMLIDTFAPKITNGSGTLNPFSMPVKIDMATRLSNEVQMLKEHGVTRLFHRLRARMLSYVLRGKALDYVERVSPTYARSKRTSIALMSAARTYQTGPYDGSADLILSKPIGAREVLLLEQYPTLGWSDLIAQDKLTITRLDTDHRGLVTGQFAEVLARLIEDRLSGKPGNRAQ